MFRRPFRYRRRFYGPWAPWRPMRGPRFYRRGCGCGGLGLSLVLSALMTWLLSLFMRRY